MKLVVSHLSILLVLLVSINDLSHQQTVNPGFRVIITTKGLKYAQDVGLSLLKEWLCSYAIPTVNITSQTGIAWVNYNFSNIDIHSLDFGNISFSSDERGFVLTITDVSFTFSSDFLIQETDWPYFTDRGSGNVSVRAVSLEVSVGIVVNGTDPLSGQFALNLTSCYFSVHSITAVFSGGASYLYNLFGLALNDFMKYELNKKMCTQLAQFTNDTNEKYIDSVPIIYPVGDGVEIDYGLVADANFSRKGLVITDHKGEFLLQSDPTDPPFSAPPLPDPSNDVFNDSKMIYIVVSKYVAESASYAFMKAGQLETNITSDQLWLFKNTEAWCASEFVPKALCDKYPDRSVMLGIAVTSYPTMKVTTSYATLETEASFTMYVTNSSGEYEEAFVLGISVRAQVKPYFKSKEKHVCGHISGAGIDNVTLLESQIGNFNTTKLKDLIKNVLVPLGVGYVNKQYTDAGFPIPTKDGVSFVNSELTLGEGCIVVGTDISYTPTFLKSNMTCIYRPF